MVPESFETARLFLRKPRRSDAPLLFASYVRDPAVTRYLTWRPHTDLSDSTAVIERFLTGWQEKNHYCWFLFDRAKNDLIGCLAARVEDNGFNLGYVLAREWWGRGLIPEAINAVTDWALGESAVARVWAFCDVENYASARALEKAGFEREGLLEKYSLHPNISSEPRDCYSYTRVRPR